MRPGRGPGSETWHCRDAHRRSPSVTTVSIPAGECAVAALDRSSHLILTTLTLLVNGPGKLKH